MVYEEPSIGASSAESVPVSGACSALPEPDCPRALLDASPEAILLLSLDGRIRYANQAAGSLLGMAPARLLGCSPHQVFATDVAERHLAQIRHVCETGEPVDSEELLPIGDTRRWTQRRLSPVRDAAGRVTGVAVFVADITTRVQARRELELDEERLEALLKLARMQDATIEGLAAFAMEEAVRLTRSEIGYLAFPNEDESVLTMHAWSRQAMEECRIRDCTMQYPVATTGLWGEAVRQRRPIITNDYAAPSPLKKGYPEGHVAIRRHMNVPIFDGESIVVVIGVANKATEYDESDIRQITLLGDGLWRVVRRHRAEDERARLESRLQEARHLEALGQLTGGVSHDFNNIIQVVLGNTDLALMSTSRLDARRQYLEEIRAASERAAGLVRQLLAFSRQEKHDPKPLDLGALVLGLSRMLARLIGDHIELVFDAPGHPLPVTADPGQIEQVILNLAVNARDAMPGGGRLVLSLSETTLDAELCHSLGTAEPGSHVLLTVADNGTGIPPEARARIFEPFFTTKGQGKGTGLGLATAYGIVRQHGGAISVYSEVGLGATFRIYLPASPRAALCGAARADDGPVGPGGSETILLAEDEPSVRAVARRVLTEAGYRVLVAQDGLEAIEMAAEHADEIALALLDVVMPKATGPVVAEVLNEANPRARVLFCSGYAPGSLGPQLETLGHAGFLAKPYTAIQLLGRVREVLDGPSQPVGQRQ